MIIQRTSSFERQFKKLPQEIQLKAAEAISLFIDCYVHRQFPKGLRVHRCGPFVSLSIDMNYRIFIYPIVGGIRFVFVGTHDDADSYLKK